MVCTLCADYASASAYMYLVHDAITWCPQRACFISCVSTLGIFKGGALKLLESLTYEPCHPLRQAGNLWGRVAQSQLPLAIESPGPNLPRFAEGNSMPEPCLYFYDLIR